MIINKNWLQTEDPVLQIILRKNLAILCAAR